MRALGTLMSVLNTAAGLLVFALMLIITADVICRSVFSIPLYGIPEITKLSIVAIVWLQMAYTLRERRHLRSNLILASLPVRGQRFVILLNCLVGAVLMGVIAYYSWPEMVRAWRFNAFEGEHPLRIPTWPFWSVVVLGSALTSLEYAIQGWQAVFGAAASLDNDASVVSE